MEKSYRETVKCTSNSKPSPIALCFFLHLATIIMIYNEGPIRFRLDQHTTGVMQRTCLTWTTTNTDLIELNQCLPLNCFNNSVAID